MLTVFFAITTGVCAVGWLTRKISCAALLYYIEKSGYKMPNDEDLTECTRWAAKQMFKA